MVTHPYTGTLAPLLVLATLATLLGCTRTPDGQEDQRSSPAGELAVSVHRLASIRTLASDTLSDSARVDTLFPEPDHRSVAFLFSDHHRGVFRGLGIINGALSQTRLLWPDSVEAVWWSAPHRLSFTSTTGQGVYVVINVHAAQLQTVRDSASIAERGGVAQTPTPVIDSTVARRLSQFVDSLHIQPEGQITRGALRYVVTATYSSADSLLAFQTVGVDSTGKRFNPTWYATAWRIHAIAPIDSMVGATQSMPAAAAAWRSPTAFVYTRDATLYEAQVREVPIRAPANPP